MLVDSSTLLHTHRRERYVTLRERYVTAIAYGNIIIVFKSARLPISRYIATIYREINIVNPNTKSEDEKFGL